MAVRVLGSTVKRLSTRGDSKETDIGRRCLPIPREAIPSADTECTMNISEIDRFRATPLARRGGQEKALARRMTESKWLLNIQCAHRIA